MSFIKDLLWFINEIGEVLPEGKGGYTSLNKRLRGYDRTTYYNSLYRLERKGLIKKKIKTAGVSTYVITASGKKALQQGLKKYPRHDGLGTLIAYDVPSSRNKQRTIFRRYLLKNSFIQIQDSLLISPNRLDDHLVNVMKELKITKYVKIISGRFDYIKLD